MIFGLIVAMDESLKFGELCVLLESLVGRDKRRGDKKIILKDFMCKLSATQVPSRFYSVVRLLIPRVDHRSFGIGQKTLGRLICSALDLSAKTSSDALALISAGVPGGDYCEFAARAMFRRLSSARSDSELSVDDVNEFLDELCGDGHGAFERLIRWPSLSELSLKWLFRVILKEVDSAIGFSDSSIVQCVHCDLGNCLKSNVDLRSAIERVLGKSDFELGKKGFKPMLSQRLNGDCFSEDLSDYESVIVQLKLDGERVQVHCCSDGQKVYVSRGGFDFSSSYAQMNSMIRASFDGSIDNCVLDGEMMVYDKRNDKFLPKGRCSLDVKKLNSSDDDNYCPRFCVFDLTHLNGQCLFSRPLTERLSMLRRLVRSNPSIFVLDDIEIIDSSNFDRILLILEQMTNKQEEGIVLKDPKSEYVPGGRNGAGWFKLKPDYVDDLASDIDLLVVGVRQQRTGSSQKLKSLGLAIKSADSRLFRLIAHLSSGLSNENLRFLSEKAVFDADLDSGWLCLDRRSDKCDFYVREARFGLVATVRAAEIIVDDEGRFSLRFPRLRRLRDPADKSWEDVCGENEIRKIARSMNRTTTKRISVKEKVIERDLEFIDSPKFDLKSPEVISVSSRNRLLGKEVCLMADYRALERLVLDNGGQCTRLPARGRTWVVVMEPQKCLGVRTKRIIDRFKVVSPEWLKRFVDGDGDLEEGSPKTVRIERLKMRLRKVAAVQNVDFAKLKLAGLDLGVFGGMRFYCRDLSELQMWAIEVKLNGGRIVDDVDLATHLVTDENCFPGKVCVSPEWIIDQISATVK